MNEAFAKLLASRDAIATPLLVGLVDEFGTEFFSWDPDTLVAEVKSEWRINLHQANSDKIQALLTVLTTDRFTGDLQAFIHVCNSLAGQGASFEVYDPADVTEMCWALAEIGLTDPLGEKEKFTNDISIYMAAKMDEEGLQKAPKLLAPHVSLPDRTQLINDTLSADGIDHKAYFDSQQRSLMNIDVYVRERMLELVQQLGGLKLQSAQPGALEDLTARAQKALAVQSQQTAKAQASLPRASFL